MQLIDIQLLPVGRDMLQTVNARELHAFLQVGKVFAAWIQERIHQYGFLENQDYVIGFPNLENQKTGRGGDRRSKDYHLTLDMAKELAMVERNDKGKQARRYFIDCERRAKEVVQQPAADTQLLQQTLAALQPLLAALAQLATPASLPPVMSPPPAANPSRLHGVRQYVKLRDEDWECILDMVESGRESGAQLAREYGISSSTICRRLTMRQQRQRASQTPRPSVQAAYSVTDAAKMLNQSPRRLFKWLAENRWIYRRSAGSPWTAYQDKLENGWLQVRLLDIPHSDGSPRDVQQVQVTPAGLARLENLLQAVA